jgi:hypothetical protein
MLRTSVTGMSGPTSWIAAVTALAAVCGSDSHRQAEAEGLPSLTGRGSELVHGHVDRVDRARFVERVGLYISDDADDFARCVGEKCQSQMLTDRIFVGKEAVCERIADQDDARTARRVGFFEVAAANYGHMHGA